MINRRARRTRFLAIIAASILGGCAPFAQRAPKLGVWTSGDVGAPREVASVYAAVLDEIFPRDSGPSLIVIEQLTEPTEIEIDFTAKKPTRRPDGVVMPFRYRIPLEFVDTATLRQLFDEGRRADSLAYTVPTTNPLYYQHYAAPFMRKFPGAWGRVLFGRVGFGPHRDYAVVQARFFSINPVGDSGREMFYLRKVGAVWKVVDRIPREALINPVPPSYAMLHGWGPVDDTTATPARSESSCS